MAGGLCLLLLGLAWWPERPPGPTGGWLREAGLSPREMVVDGLRLRYVRSGAGPGTPTVVLLHGLGSSIFTWHAVLPELARTSDVVALDLPGSGGSDWPARLSAATLERAVLGLLDRLEVSRASLVGNSLGGAVAVLVAARHPERVVRLVLIDSAGYNLDPADRPWLVRMLQALPAGRLVEQLPVRRALFRMALRQCFYDDGLVTRERVDEYLAPVFRPGVVAALQAQLASHEGSEDFSGLVRAIRAPTLIVWGRDDEWIPLAHGERFAAELQRSRLVILDECGHLPQEERPTEVVRLMEDHFGSQP